MKKHLWPMTALILALGLVVTSVIRQRRSDRLTARDFAALIGWEVWRIDVPLRAGDEVDIVMKHDDDTSVLWTWLVTSTTGDDFIFAFKGAIGPDASSVIATSIPGSRQYSRMFFDLPISVVGRHRLPFDPDLNRETWCLDFSDLESNHVMLGFVIRRR